VDIKRPINLDITTIKFPLAAIASILHRITGVVLFLGMSIFLYLLQLSLKSEAGFTSALELFNRTSVKLIIWALIICVAYHLIAGLKHLLLDFGLGETKVAAEHGAKILLASLVLISVLAGVWLW
tara:strand:- start:360 stop:734 length:375 start_codon:yes stop_codon:yes gene_type:complete